MTEKLMELGRNNFGALRDLTILWSLLGVSLIALAWLGVLAGQRRSIPSSADILKALAFGASLVLGVALLAWLASLSLIVGPKLGLTEYEVAFVDAIILVACCIAVVRLMGRYGGQSKDRTEDRGSS